MRLRRSPKVPVNYFVAEVEKIFAKRKIKDLESRVKYLESELVGLRSAYKLAMESFGRVALQVEQAKHDSAD